MNICHIVFLVIVMLCCSNSQIKINFGWYYTNYPYLNTLINNTKFDKESSVFLQKIVESSLTVLERDIQ